VGVPNRRPPCFLRRGAVVASRSYLRSGKSNIFPDQRGTWPAWLQEQGHTRVGCCWPGSVAAVAEPECRSSTHRPDSVLAREQATYLRDMQARGAEVGSPRRAGRIRGRRS